MAEGVVVFVAYLLGAIPFGLIFGRAFGSVDVRTQGSRNIGAANVARVAGKTAGLLTLVFDALKGAVAVLMAQLLLDGEYFASLCALAALLGHMFPVFLRFRGGKGVATGLGVFTVLAPIPIVLSLGVFIVVFGVSRIVSLSSLASTVSLAVLCRITEKPDHVLVLSSATCLLVVVRHRSNIIRVFRKSEPKF